MPRARSEYTRQFSPTRGQRDEAVRCYQSGVEYRRGRRLLEHAHVPLLWEPDHADSDSSDGGRSPARAAGGDVRPREGDGPSGGEGDGPSGGQGDAECVAASLRVDGSEQGQGVPSDEREGQLVRPAQLATVLAAEQLYKKGKRMKLSIKQDSDNKEMQAPGSYLNGRNKTSPRSASGSCQRVASKRNAQTTSPHVSKSQKPQGLFARTTRLRPPFLSYGWANNVLETGRKKTHNILPSASTVHIHESAIKAMHKRKNARLQIKNKKVKLAEKQREHLHSTSDMDNPWLSEYQRSYSARTR